MYWYIVTDGEKDRRFETTVTLPLDTMSRYAMDGPGFES